MNLFLLTYSSSIAFNAFFLSIKFRYFDATTYQRRNNIGATGIKQIYNSPSNQPFGDRYALER